MKADCRGTDNAALRSPSLAFQEYLDEVGGDHDNRHAVTHKRYCLKDISHDIPASDRC